VVNVLNPATHNNRVYRTGSELCPGMPLNEWRVGDLAHYAHVDMLRICLAQLQADSESGSIPEAECDASDADVAAGNGDMEVIQLLRAHDIHCTSDGANFAAKNGHLDVIHDLREHDIHCTERGADEAAEDGNLEIIRDLRADGIHCTSRGANLAAG